MSCFQGLFFCPDAASLLLHNFCSYHIDAPGHEVCISITNSKLTLCFFFLCQSNIEFNELLVLNFIMHKYLLNFSWFLFLILYSSQSGSRNFFSCPKWESLSKSRQTFLFPLRPNESPISFSSVPNENDNVSIFYF